MATRRRTNKSIAVATGKSENYVSRVFNGWQAPSPTFRAQVAALLELPEEVLFRCGDWFQVAS